MPGPGSGLAGTWGLKTETTFGTYAAPDHFLEVESADVKLQPNRMQGQGLDGLTVDRGSRFVEVGRRGEGGLETLVFNKSMLTLLKHIFGTSSGPTQQGGTPAYQTVFTIPATGTTDGLFFTGQAGVPDLAGTVHAKSWLGCKIPSAEFACEPGDFLKLACDVIARDVSDASSLSAPSFLTNMVPFSWPQLAVSLGTFGSEAAMVTKGIRGTSFKVEWSLRDDRDYAGSAGLIAEPIANDKVQITGELDADYIDKTVFADRFRDKTPFSLIQTWTGAQISGVYYELFKVEFPQCYFTGSGESLEGPDIVTGPFPYEVKYDDVHAPVTVTCVTAETAL